VNYDVEIARLVDLYSTKCSTLTGKPEHRKRAAINLLREMAEAIKKVVREGTLEFYNQKNSGMVPDQGPLFAPRQPYIPAPMPGARPPIRG
jgi:hypothetical protein